MPFAPHQEMQHNRFVPYPCQMDLSMQRVDLTAMLSSEEEAEGRLSSQMTGSNEAYRQRLLDAQTEVLGLEAVGERVPSTPKSLT